MNCALRLNAPALVALLAAILLAAPASVRSQPSYAEQVALDNLPINGFVVFTDGDPTSEMGRGKGVYRYNLKQTSITTINTRGRWATIHPSGSIIAYAKPVGPIDLPNLQTQFYNIVLTDPDGTELCRLSHDSIPNLYALAWTDDNRIIYGASAAPDGMNGYGTSVYMIDMAGHTVLVKDHVVETPARYNPNGVIVGVSELAVAGTRILFRRGLAVYLADFDPANPQNGWTNERQTYGDVRCGSTLSYDGTMAAVNIAQHRGVDVILTQTFPTVLKMVSTVAASDDYHFVSNAGSADLYKRWLVFCTQTDLPRDIYVVNSDDGRVTRISWTGGAMAPTKPFLWLAECSDNTAPTQGPQNPACTVVSPSLARLNWGSGADPDCNGIVNYRISRRNESTSFQVIGVSFATDFEDITPRSGQVTTYGIQAVNSGGLLSPMVTVAVNEGGTQDTSPPKLQDAFNTSANNVWVVFDEPIDSTTAVSPSRFAVNNGAQVLSVVLSENGRTVGLGTTNLANGQVYTLTVSNIEDRATPANILTTASVNFTALIRDTSGGPTDTVLTLLTPDGDTTYRLGDTLKVVWDSYDGPVIPELSLNNGRSYPVPLSSDVIWETSMSWVIPNDPQYLSESVKVRISDIYSSTTIRRDVSASGFRIVEESAEGRSARDAGSRPWQNRVVVTRQGASVKLGCGFRSGGVSARWRMLILGIDGRMHAVVAPARIGDGGSTAEFNLPEFLSHAMCIAVVNDERGIERGRWMLPASL